MDDSVVKQLRRMAMRTTDSEERNTLTGAADEIVRLRVAGDQLHAWMTINSTSSQQNRADLDKVLKTWEEARRG